MFGYIEFLMNRRQRERKEKKDRAKTHAATDIAPHAVVREQGNSEPSAVDGHPAHNSEHITRRPKFWRWLIDVKSSNVASVLLTIAIAGATVYYAVYSKRQWQVVKRQADDAEAVQGARLSFEDFHADSVPNQ